MINDLFLFLRSFRFDAHLDRPPAFGQLPWKRSGQRAVAEVVGNGRLGCQDGRIRPGHLAD